MTTKTRAQLVAQAADELGIVGSGQSLADEDEDKIDGRVDGLLGELAIRGVVDVADETAIPVEWCGPLSELLANEVATVFGKPKKSQAEREMIEERLRVMIQRVPAANTVLQIDSTLQGTSNYSYSRWVSGT